MIYIIPRIHKKERQREKDSREVSEGQGDIGLRASMEEVIVEALLSGEREAQILAARELCNLTTKQRHKLAERGVISPLVLMLHGHDHEAVEAALLALLSLAFRSERNKVRIAKSGAIPILPKILQSQESLVELAIAALLILSTCKANKLPIAASGAIQLLVEFLNAQFTEANNIWNLSTQANLDILSTLHNLSTCPQIIPTIALSGVAKSLLHLMQNSEKSSELVEKATAMLEQIISSAQITLEEVAETPAVIQVLVEAIEEGTPLCKEHAVGTLLLICQSCRDRYRGTILREGAMPGLLQLSVDGTCKAREKAKALLLLLRDSSKFANREKQSKNQILEHVMRQIDMGGRTGIDLRLVEEMIAKLKT